MRVLSLPDIPSTRGSFLHLLPAFRPNDLGNGWARGVRIFLAFGGLLYLAIVIAAVAELPELWVADERLRLPFLRDANAAFAFLVSFPVLGYFLLSDDELLRRALRELQAGGVLRIETTAAASLAERWTTRFARANVSAQVLAVAVAVAVGVGNHVAYARPEAGFWILVDGRVSVAGWLFITGIGAFYAVVTLYVIRSFAVTWFLRDLVRVARLKILPFHPDNCGGLRPVGRIALRSQYTLTILGVNLAILLWLTFNNLGAEPGIAALVLLAAVAYLVLGPVVFLAPLLPFRAGMLHARAEMLTLVAREAEIEVDRLTAALSDHRIGEYDIAALERLHRVGDLIAEQPIWPFDVTTLRKFLTAYIIPIAGFGLALVLNVVLESIVAATMR